jgi:hypothetical protein
MKKIASISTNSKRNPIKARFLLGTMLSAVVWGSVHATPLDKALVVAQAPPQSEQEDKKQAPQRPGQRQKQQEERREAPKPPPGARLHLTFLPTTGRRRPHPVSSRYHAQKTRPSTRKANKRSKVTVGTTHISIAAIASEWLRRKVFQFCERGL